VAVRTLRGLAFYIYLFILVSVLCYDLETHNNKTKKRIEKQIEQTKTPFQLNLLFVCPLLLDVVLDPLELLVLCFVSVLYQVVHEGIVE